MELDSAPIFLKRNLQFGIIVLYLKSGTLILFKDFQPINQEKLLIPLNSIKIAEIKDKPKIFCADKMGQIWQFNGLDLKRESVGKVSGSIIKMKIDPKSETIILLASTKLVVQLSLGEKKMRKKIGLNIRKEKNIEWNISFYSSLGLTFISEKNLITFVDLRRKRVEKINVSKWLGDDNSLKDFSIDQKN